MAKVIKVWTGTEWVDLGIQAENITQSISGGNAATVFDGIINGGNAI